MLRGDLGRPKRLMAELEVDEEAPPLRASATIPAPFHYCWLTGSLSVRNSSFTSLFDGGPTDGFSTRVCISPWCLRVSWWTSGTPPEPVLRPRF
jgi:hypothetical protein